MDAMRLLAADGVQTLQPTEVEQFPPKGEDLPHAFFLLTGKATQAQQHAYREAAAQYKSKFWFGAVPDVSEESPKPLGSVTKKAGGAAQLVAVYKNGKQKALFDLFEPAVLEAPSLAADVVTFIEDQAYPPVVAMVPGTYRGLAASSKKGVPTVMALMSGDDGLGNAAVVKPLMEAREATSHKFRFATVDMSQKILREWAHNTFDLRAGVRFPTVVVIFIMSREYVPYPDWATESESLGPPSGAALARFLEKVARDELERRTTGDANTLDVLKAKFSRGVSAFKNRFQVLRERFMSGGQSAPAQGEF